MIRDVSLIVEGGGMRGFYSGGVLKRLLDEGLRFAYVIGISSGSLCAAAYVGDRLDLDFSQMKRGGMLSFVNARGFVAPREGILNTSSFIDFLVERACEPALRSTARLLIPATSAQTGELTWWDQRDCATPSDLRQRIVASSSIPFVMPQTSVDGSVYADGGIRDSIPLQHAIDDGLRRHVLILSRERGYRKGPQHLELYLRHVLKPYPRLKDAMLKRHIHYNEAIEQVEAAEDAGSAFVFRPRAQRLGRFEYNPDKFALDFNDGYEMAREMLPQLRAFIGADR
ncbi:MAG: patatin family protein [Coriobacteriia bacterium]|nr:patatin family protein [Coriobacteriia bacterium]MBS5478387.1 patatin family protein [Coriobacteriia bacterium]